MERTENKLIKKSSQGSTLYSALKGARVPYYIKQYETVYHGLITLVVNQCMITATFNIVIYNMLLFPIA